jgi:glucose-6-phosphate isomerase
MSRMADRDQWTRFQEDFRTYTELGLSLDTSRMNFPDGFMAKMGPRMDQAFDAMEALESGAISNPDEGRMVGHYWLRNPELAPNAEIRGAIVDALSQIDGFVTAIHDGQIKGAGGDFKNFLVIGIGGSALGPQFVATALGNPETDRLKPHFFDNTDPDGMDKVIQTIGSELGQTLSIVISKSGGTKETRNGMLEAKRAYEAAGLNFAEHAVAVTGDGSLLDGVAAGESWLRRFPMWDWVGGRTSELSAVGLLPAALQGISIAEFLEGAKSCDISTRNRTVSDNPAAILALTWHYIVKGVGSKDMVVLPYKDRLELFSKYLQQLIMESLGKELDLDGKVVNQGISVYGNKGSTDQHAYVQQLREGVLNFFVVFIEVLKDRQGDSKEVEQGVTSGDFLSGFYLGTRDALYENGRESISITIDEVSAFSVGALIALFERAVGYYASLVNVNAYHQPGVEAGKKAAGAVIELQLKILDALREAEGGMTVNQIADQLGSDQHERIFKVCNHLDANRSEIGSTGDGFDRVFTLS